MEMEQSVPKRRHINFRRRGVTQKKAYNIQNTVKVLNEEYFDLLSDVSKYQHRTNLCSNCRTSRSLPKNKSDLLVNRAAFLLNADKLGKVKKKYRTTDRRLLV